MSITYSYIPGDYPTIDAWQVATDSDTECHVALLVGDSQTGRPGGSFTDTFQGPRVICSLTPRGRALPFNESGYLPELYYMGRVYVYFSHVVGSAGNPGPRATIKDCLIDGGGGWGVAYDGSDYELDVIRCYIGYEDFALPFSGQAIYMRIDAEVNDHAQRIRFISCTGRTDLYVGGGLDGGIDIRWSNFGFSSPTSEVYIYRCSFPDTYFWAECDNFFFPFTSLQVVNSCFYQILNASDGMGLMNAFSHCATQDTSILAFGSTHVDSYDPYDQFEDYDNYDFRLKSGSDFIGAGFPLAGITHDPLDMPIPQGCEPDLGAFERFSNPYWCTAASEGGCIINNSSCTQATPVQNEWGVPIGFVFDPGVVVCSGPYNCIDDCQAACTTTTTTSAP